MSEQLTTPFLPLGSIVELTGTNDDQLLYLIVARAIAKNEKDEIVSRYRVAPHPFGDVPAQEVFSINVEQIVKVIFEGYANARDDEFLEDLLHKMMEANDETVPVTSNSEVEEINAEPVDTDREKLKEDPFYKFRKRGT